MSKGISTPERTEAFIKFLFAYFLLQHALEALADFFNQ